MAIREASIAKHVSRFFIDLYIMVENIDYQISERLRVHWVNLGQDLKIVAKLSDSQFAQWFKFFE